MKTYLNTNQIEAPEADYLYTGLSQLPNAGKGLFTAIKIYKDEIIAIYKGEVLSEKEAARRSQQGIDNYFINMLDGSIMDSLNVECFAKYANDAAANAISAFKNNVKISLDDDDNVCLVATRNIKTGEEIFCSYGARYWKKHSKQLNF
jgi:SET domain-containing protein